MKVIKDYETRLYKRIKETPDEYQETGQISGSKVAQPTLTAILTMLGIEKPFDEYTLAKFMRGHDVEAKFIERAFDKPIEITETGQWNCEDSVFTWQYEMEKGYRGCTCSVDVLEKTGDCDILHEIKSVSKMKYDRVCGTGFQKNKVDPMADPSHCLQLTLYAKSYEKINGTKPRCLIHYVNSDDYRVTTFEINPDDYIDELGRRIDLIYQAFELHSLPAYEPFEAWQKGKYNSFQELEKLTPAQVEDYVKEKYPEAWNKFALSKVTEGGIEYEVDR